MNKKVIVAVIVGLFILGLLLFPVPVGCGAPGASCRTAPDQYGYSYAYTVIEPFGVVIVEGLLQINIPLYYYKYSDVPSFDTSCVPAGKYIGVKVPRDQCCKGLREIELTPEESLADGISAKCVE